jgi:hypothetical protein
MFNGLVLVTAEKGVGCDARSFGLGWMSGTYSNSNSLVLPGGTRRSTLLMKAIAIMEGASTHQFRFVNRTSEVHGN